MATANASGDPGMLPLAHHQYTPLAPAPFLHQQIFPCLFSVSTPAALLCLVGVYSPRSDRTHWPHSARVVCEKHARCGFHFLRHPQPGSPSELSQIQSFHSRRDSPLSLRHGELLRHFLTTSTGSSTAAHLSAERFSCENERIQAVLPH